ncbi:MAG: type VI secretion system tube protein Hcp, partial [Candidatus Competibacteraceae bacterium]
MADAFLKIGDVKGECKDAEYKEWIEVLSWSWGASQLGTAGHGTGLGASKVSLNDFSYTMNFCAASPQLLLSCCSGHHYPEATLVMRKPTGKDGGQKKFLEFKFKEVMVSSYQTGGSEGAGLPIESLSLNFTSMTQEYFTQDEKGA